MRMNPHTTFLQLLLVAAVLVTKATARLGTNSSWANDWKPKVHRSIQDLSENVFEEMRVLHDGSAGFAASFRLGHVARRVHKLVVEGSANLGEEFGPHARRRALEALNLGGRNMMQHLKQQREQLWEDYSNSIQLQEEDVAYDATGHGGPWKNKTAASRQQRDLQLSAANVLGILAFTALIVFLLVLIVNNLVNAATGGTNWPFLASDNDYLNGAPGVSFQNISPCNKLPLASTELFGYLPITQGIVGNILALFYDLVDPDPDASKMIMESVTDPNQLASDPANIASANGCLLQGQTCEYTAECCRDPAGVDVVSCDQGMNQCVSYTPAQVAGGQFSYEPWCIAWSRTDEASLSTTIDTFAFTPLFPWPPVFLPPISYFLPLCPLPLNPGFGVGQFCKGCEFINGFPIADVVIGKIPFKLTIQWDGVALSWADQAKLAYGANLDTGGANAPQIWDGFRNQPLPEISDFNFWTKLILNLIPSKQHQLAVTQCATFGGGIFSLLEKQLPASAKTLAIQIDLELYVAIDRQSTDGEALGNDLADDLTGGDGTRRRRRLHDVPGSSDHHDEDPSRFMRNMQEISEDPCIILAMTRAAIRFPYVGNLVFADAIGGFCIFSPEETGVRCTPSGYFFNIRNQYRFEGLIGFGIDKLIGFLDSQTDEVSLDTDSSGNSIGVFQDENGDTEAVVFRLEFPAQNIFGVNLGGVGRPVIHFQYAKGSEIERRRSTLLRKRTAQGVFVANCQQIAQECEQWDPFETTDGIETEICSDFLINADQDPDKLLYYNRVLTAEPVDESQTFVITPPDGQTYRTPPKYDFSMNLDGDVFIVFLALQDFGNFVILVEEVSLSLIFSPGPPPIQYSDVMADFDAAQSAYDLLSDEQKQFWDPPSLFNFDLTEYLAYLPTPNADVTEAQVDAASLYNKETEDAESDRLAVFSRLFCQISVLFFVSISLGIIFENFADGVTPSLWALAGQFQFDTIGFSYSVAVSTEFDFDSRRRRHLEGEEFQRALQSDGLEEAAYTVLMSVECTGLCEIIVEFLKNAGEAIWSGMQAIGKFFTEDIVEGFNNAVAAVGEWGEKFIGGIIDFGESVVSAFEDAFENGETAQLLGSEQVVAYTQDAQELFTDLAAGGVTLDNALALGELVIEGAEIVVDFIVAGVTDLVTAIGNLISDNINKVFQAVGDVVGLDLGAGSQEWTEIRGIEQTSFQDISSCKAGCDSVLNSGDADAIKRNCWCMDEVECPVKIAQARTCSKVCVVFCVDKGCSDWTNVPIEERGGFPRYESRSYDQGCREERFAKMVRADNILNQMTTIAEKVDDNMQRKFKGLNNFSPANLLRRRQRKLQTGSDPVTSIDSLSVPSFTAVEEGNFGSRSFSAMYNGAQLRPDSDNVNNVNQEFTRDIDFSIFERNGQTLPSAGDDSVFVEQARLGSTDQYLGALELDDPEWIAKQPIIEAPILSFAAGSPGSTIDDPVVFGCNEGTGNIGTAWMNKLEGSEPETLQSTRSRRLQSGPIEESNVDIAIIANFRKRLVNKEGVDIVTDQGGGAVGVGDDDDVFAAARDLIGTDGVGSFMETQNLPLATFELDITIVRAEPLCDQFEWTFEVVAVTSSGKRSDPITVYAMLQYGQTELQEPILNVIQTFCDTDGLGVEDLEDNQPLLYFYGFDNPDITSLQPKLRNDNCRSPLVSLESVDTPVQEGVPCTTTYKTIQRDWSIVNLDGSCPPDGELPQQTIIAGGYEIPGPGDGIDGVVVRDPPTPFYDVQDVTYVLPNEQDATVSSNVNDFFVNGEIPVSTCGLCDVDPIVTDIPDELDCTDVGDIEVTITVTNRVGISVTKTATVTVVDNSPPNLFTMSHTLFLNSFGQLNSSDVVTVADIDAGSFDNCAIELLTISPTTIYQCGDEGPQTVTLFAQDTSGNTNSLDQIISVVDSLTRPAINNNEPITIPREPTDDSIGDFIDEKLQDDFGVVCEETSLSVRANGDSNFVPYQDFPTDPDDWEFPNEYDPNDPQSVSFYQAICGGVLPDNIRVTEVCEAEVKAEASCTDTTTGNTQQTCYRAKILFDPMNETTEPSETPSDVPSRHPSKEPSASPSAHPSAEPSYHPSAAPSAHPSDQPSGTPSATPSNPPSPFLGRCWPLRDCTTELCRDPMSDESCAEIDVPFVQADNPAECIGVDVGGRTIDLPYYEDTDRNCEEVPVNPLGDCCIDESCKDCPDMIFNPEDCPDTATHFLSYNFDDFAEVFIFPCDPITQYTPNPTPPPTSDHPSDIPSDPPSPIPSSPPSDIPSDPPSPIPSSPPSNIPSDPPSPIPSSPPSDIPSDPPSPIPSNPPSDIPSDPPSPIPSSPPSDVPSDPPSPIPSSPPTDMIPSNPPSPIPSSPPSDIPSDPPSPIPSSPPSDIPSDPPSPIPSSPPSDVPSNPPSPMPDDTTPKPTPAPTPRHDNPSTPGMMGDPHLMSWNGEFFEYMGECDLVLLHVANFNNGNNDLTVHVRTTIRYDYSFIQEAAVRIGEDTLEVSAWGDYSFNDVENALIHPRKIDAIKKKRVVKEVVSTMGGFPIFHTMESKKRHTFDIVLGHNQNITIGSVKDIVSVKIHHARSESFAKVEGILGDYSGRMLARDGITDLHDDINKMADEWQVKSGTDQILFGTARAPQYPDKCRLPNSSNIAAKESRRLGEGITEEEAAKACSRVVKGNAAASNPAAFAACVYDVTATNDVDQASAYR